MRLKARLQREWRFLRPALERAASGGGLDVDRARIEQFVAVVNTLVGTLEQDIAQAEVRSVFKVPKIGAIAGCYVLEGTVKRNAGVRVIRDGVEIHSGKISSLKRFKDDAKEVAAGYECGIGLADYTDVKEGDILEIFEQIQVTRKLSETTSGRNKA